jgi:hypothetical protein
MRPKKGMKLHTRNHSLDSTYRGCAHPFGMCSWQNTTLALEKPLVLVLLISIFNCCTVCFSSASILVIMTYGDESPMNFRVDRR